MDLRELFGLKEHDGQRVLKDHKDLQEDLVHLTTTAAGEITLLSFVSHNLGTQDVLVYLLAKNENGSIINQAHSFFIFDDNTVEILRVTDNPYPSFEL